MGGANGIEGFTCWRDRESKHVFGGEGNWGANEYNNFKPKRQKELELVFGQ
jgi:hypothetical protein